MFKQYDGVASIFKMYWASYGGLAALLRSPYLHGALVLLLVTFQVWNEPSCSIVNGVSQCTGWWDQSISALPNMLGFTLGGFAIFLGFGDAKFSQLLSETDESSGINPYVGLCSSFVHFVVVQALALITAVVAKSWWFYTPLVDPIRPALPYLNALGGALGYGLFLYALASVLAATMHIFRIAVLYAHFQGTEKKSGTDPKA